LIFPVTSRFVILSLRGSRRAQHEGYSRHQSRPETHWAIFAGHQVQRISVYFRQVGVDPVSGEFAGPSIQQQTERMLENVKAILEAGGASLSHVVKTTVFLKDMNDFAAMNEVYARYFTAAPPARSTVQVARLPKDALVEIEVVAAI